MTIYSLEFLPSAQREWDKLDLQIRRQLARKLQERLEHPRIPSAQLSGLTDCYKIKLRSSGYRLVYRVFDDRILVQVIAIGRRDRNQVYKAAADRLD